MSAPVIEASGLTKRYGRALAVDGLDLTIGAGEVFGLLGPNGSGKTTTILMLLGLTEPTGGSVRVLGFDPLRQPLEVKRRVGYLPDQVGFYDTLSARENLVYSARLLGLASGDAAQRIDRALSVVGLAEVADRRVSTFSHGMRQRLGVAELLVKEARVAILDEPTNGLDPQGTSELLALILNLKAEGMTVLLSSHLLGLVQSICDRVALFRKGRVGLVGPVDELARDVLGGAYVVEIETEGVDLAGVLEGMDGIAGVARSEDGRSRVDADRDLRKEIARRVVEAGGGLRNMTLTRTSLDEIYSRYFEQEEMSDAA
ncbi:MAG: ABC transporter ATP-binding protein [Bauldia sp.]|uniref:ABC transporter ATP-binding protein n=1 Tax=Bauldia sp. TaxID=2575872 RepID=UPI001DF2479F|nr:ABC transporter ATP-binding protein [Bauldia sp.]MCB1494482.1 ABC transporter ATP-binding protein [Bauldia sp.]